MENKNKIGSYLYDHTLCYYGKDIVYENTITENKVNYAKREGGWLSSDIYTKQFH